MISRAQLILKLLKQKRDPAQILVRLAMRDALIGCQSALDVGCGASPALREMGVPQLTGIEGYEPCVEEARRLKTHDRIVQGNVTRLEDYFKPKQFDACIAIDLIEHLKKEEGLKLMAAMESLAKKRAIFFTPSGFLPQGHTEKDDLQAHHSGWEAAEMKGHGYRVIGLLGPKTLRGEYHLLKKKPAAFWALVSLVAHFTSTRLHPEKAAAILCVKELGK
jgi:predicted TPR repeat methyltransferase